MLEIVLEHFKQYKAPPSKDVLKVKITEIENDILKTAVLEQLKEVFRYMESDDLSFVKDEILKFCKNQEIKRAIMDSVSLLKMGNYDEIKSKIDGAMKAGADTDIGHEYKKDVISRYNEAARHTVTTGWDVIDDLIVIPNERSECRGSVSAYDISANGLPTLTPFAGSDWETRFVSIS